MKRYLLSVFFAVAAGGGLAGAAWAENPLKLPAGPETVVIVPASTATTATAITSAVAPAGMAHTGGCSTGGCTSGCTNGCTSGHCGRSKTPCVAVPDTVTKTKVLFSSDCETKCLIAPFQFLRKAGDCTTCQDGSCGRSHVERYLYKRVQTDTCPSFKCVPGAPACAESKCGPICANGVCPGASVGAPIVVTPATPSAPVGTILAVSATPAAARRP